MKKIYLIVLTCIVVISIGGWYLNKYYKSKDETKYVTESAEKQNIIVTISGSGNIIAPDTANVNPSVSGEVSDLKAQVGDYVEQDQELFYLINTSLDLSAQKLYIAYLQSKQEVDSANTQVKQAEANLEAAKKKNEEKSNSVSETELEILNQKIEQAKTNVSVAELNVNLAWENYQDALEDCDSRLVKAPISGTITSVNIANGDSSGQNSSGNSSSDASNSSTNSSSNTSTTSGSSTAIVIQNFDTLKASIQISEVDAAKVEVGQKTTMSFDGIDELTLTGKVEKIDSVGTVSSGVVTYTATIGFDALDKRVKPGMSVTASIVTQTKQDVLAVSASAVKTSGNNKYVLVMEDGKTKEVTVEIGISNDSLVEIISGISQGQEVVTQTISSEKSTTSSTTNANSRNSGLQNLTGNSGGPMQGGPGGGF